MATISARIAQIEDSAPDPGKMAAHLASLAPGAWQDWSLGFHSLVTSTPMSWAARTIGADDKRFQRALALVANDLPDPGLAAVLPAWIAGRYACRK